MSQRKTRSTPRPLLAALAALVITALFAGVAWWGVATGSVDVPLKGGAGFVVSRADDPAMFWVVEALLAILALLALGLTLLLFRAIVRPERAGKGPPPDFR